MQNILCVLLFRQEEIPMFISRFRTRVTTIVIILIMTLSSVQPAYAASSNDSFASPTVIAGLPFSDTVDNTSATTELGEQQNCFYSPQTVWYSFTPTANVAVRVDMNRSSFSDTILNIYQDGGSGFGDLNLLQCVYFGGSIAFTAQAGVTYYFQAGSINNGGGDLNVNLQEIPPPANDNFSNATFIPSPLPFYDSIDTSSGTKETDEPTPSCGSNSFGKTAWYAFTPTSTESITANILSAPFAPVLAVYTGQSLASLSEIGCHQFHGVLTSHAIAGTTYYIQVGGFLGEGDILQLSLDVAPAPQADFYFIPFDPSKYDTIQFYDFSSDPGGVGIQSATWDFGDGSAAHDLFVFHKYAADGDYQITHSVTTYDGRSASITKTIQIYTHDVSITKVAAPTSVGSGQTRAITVSVGNKNYPETVTVDLYKSTSTGDVWVRSLTLTVPVSSGNHATQFAFNCTFTSQDAQVGKVTFHAIASISGVRDSFLQDNTAISSPTRVTR